MQQVDIAAPDGTVIPLSWFGADQPRVALLLPALGIQARLYSKLAEGLSALFPGSG
jgi:predicted alpha/beta hydrolase